MSGNVPPQYPNSAYHIQADAERIHQAQEAAEAQRQAIEIAERQRRAAELAAADQAARLRQTSQNR